MRTGEIERNFEPTADGKCATSEGGMVATAFPEATRAGVRMLEMGGNAVDAACAAALALGVCEPQSSGLGGQTMGIMHFKGRTVAIDGSSRVPSRANIDMCKKGQRTLGYKATTVPSTVATIGYLNFRYGELDWEAVVEPALEIARGGYRITALQESLQQRELDNFFAVPSASAARYFLKDGRRPYGEGELFVQKDLAWTLSRLAQKGPGSFYSGRIARMIDEDMRANGGLLCREDLALVPWPIERPPLRRKYRAVSIATMPPPAAGRTLLLVLMMLNNLPSSFLRIASPQSCHFLAETFRKAFRQRTQRPFDPNYYPQLPDKTMLSRGFANELFRTIHENIDPELPLVEPPSEDNDTTHLSVMDREGNMVGLTQSIELVYGCKAAAEGLGFLYNNYMRSLEVRNPSHPYFLRPNAVPWSSVAASVLFYRNRPWMVVGSPGSERIYSSITQFLVHMIDGNLPLGEAMLRPRMHCSIGGRISIEADRFPPEVLSYLGEMGYRIDRREPFAFYLGAVHAAMKCVNGNGFQGVAEKRRDGTAGGP